MSSDRIIVMGAGHSGCKAAQALRKHGWTGGITMVGKEGRVPYDRPPLSKAVLLGKKSHDACAFFPMDWYEQNGIDLRLGRTVQRIDPSARTVTLDGGDTLGYQKLLIATGADLIALPIPGADLPGVEGLRTPEQAARIAASLQAGNRVVVIGAGFIGLEVAAAAVEKGCQVELLEAAPHALGRSLPAPVSDALIAFHRQKGVQIRFGARVAAIEGQARAETVVLADGTRIACDVIVYGIGVRPNTAVAEAAGLTVDNGIVVDAHLQTSAPDIYACGDVTRYFCDLFHQPLRLESWKSAEEQADAVARSMVGQPVRYGHVPWFWSNQFDLTLQVSGLPVLGTRHVERAIGDSRLYLSTDDGGTTVGVSALGAVREIAMPMRVAKAFVEGRQQIDPARFADASVPLQALAGEP
ncbi:FAD-dependent oxidoreductase [Cupriavidus sp. SZY C1]|uniref:NAD(P)/FAD-dependent oxidoreductase n=1 Tax=Cupriavidus sp. SZY C1 TaxID=3055037 RepID=UPI0028B83862|nr:FAD-dependent oxidoreductase [Cupriavidus sp. SZY C1]MDT6963175.1 FAD-dependent oxidoreductase [Cupriavidus sp. SZY C1]